MSFLEKVKSINQYTSHFISSDKFKSPDRNYRMRIECNLIKDCNNNLELNNFAQNNLEKANFSIIKIIPFLLDFINRNQILKEKLFRIDFLSNQNNDVLIVLIYHKYLNQEWQDTIIKFSDNIIGISKKQRIVLSKDYVIENINLLNDNLKYKYSYGIFTQPNTLINQKMLQWVLDNSKLFKGDLLELYCGSGNFSIALSKNFNKILASELVKKAIVDAKYNCQFNNVDNIEFVRMSADEIMMAFENYRVFNRLSPEKIKSYNFTTVLVDPPREGLPFKIIKFMNNFKNIIYISCNYKTLIRDIALFQDHKIVKSALFDQFPGTNHMECGIILSK